LAGLERDGRISSTDSVDGIALVAEKLGDAGERPSASDGLSFDQLLEGAIGDAGRLFDGSK
jgi:hypothetical protein